MLLFQPRLNTLLKDCKILGPVSMGHSWYDTDGYIVSVVERPKPKGVFSKHLQITCSAKGKKMQALYIEGDNICRLYISKFRE